MAMLTPGEINTPHLARFQALLVVLRASRSEFSDKKKEEREKTDEGIEWFLAAA